MKNNYQVKFLLAINNLSLIISILMSLKLWTTRRDFPVIPVFESLLSFEVFNGYLLVSLLLGCLITLISYPKPILALLTLSLIVLLLMQDQMRWQIWVYLHSLVIVPFLYAKLKKQNLTIYVAIILIGVYFWGGVHKLNPHFFDLIFHPMMIDLLNINLSRYQFVAYLIPIVEILIAICFLFKSTRKLSFYSAIITHFVIILWLSPLYRNSNWIIFPMNIAMIYFCYFCFYKGNINFFKFTNKSKSGYLLPVLALLVITLPLLNKIEKWPYYFSFHLYSGQGKSLYIIKDEAEFLEESDDFIKSCQIVKDFNNKESIRVTNWSYNELNVPIPLDERSLGLLLEHFCQRFSGKTLMLSYDIQSPKGDYKIIECD
ncbi:MauE/DoxX family redox-associated membrane protein [Psychroflexus sp. S27]|uniref:MauE/DoxX family redox-associated membrane protein n=1 Tax=Psychroflexus sp. S27 TaxID=1982757 RepID=UPI00128FE7BC|nr:MauE/DoxX family redox-associated membrane protein [Psychroflexus sp. S27]